MKFIHLADVHLGAVPDRGCRWSEAREEEIWETFRRVIAGIRNDPVDFLFIPGDLFHRQPLLRELKEVNYLFSTIPGTRVFLTAGNHDYLRKNSFYYGYQWAENVTFFESEEVTCVHEEYQDVYIYGNSYHSREIKTAIYQDVRPVEEEGIHILLAHGGDEKHAPMDMRALSAAGFDYVALGHIHKHQILYPNQIAYAGSLEPLDRTEGGQHGYIEGTIQGGQVQIEFVPFASRTYLKLGIQIRETTTQFELEEQLKQVIARKGRQNIYRIVLKGRRSPDILLLPERLMDFGNILEIQDETRPAYQLAELEKQYHGTLIGSYIAHFREMEDMTEIEEKALYYGLQALLETTNGNQTFGNQKFRKNS